MYLLYPIPELPAHIRNILTPFSIFGGNLRYDIAHISSRNDYLKEHQYVLEQLDSLIYGKDLVAVKPYDLLCAGTTCPAVINNSALYFDAGHLSVFGATTLIDNSGIAIK